MSISWMYYIQHPPQTSEAITLIWWHWKIQIILEPLTRNLIKIITVTVIKTEVVKFSCWNTIIGPLLGFVDRLGWVKWRLRRHLLSVNNRRQRLKRTIDRAERRCVRSREQRAAQLTTESSSDTEHTSTLTPWSCSATRPRSISTDLHQLGSPESEIREKKSLLF